MRAFIGISFEDSVLDFLENIQRNLMRHSIKGNPTSKENFHLTLYFLGEIVRHEQDEIEKALDELYQLDSFKISLNHLGAFNHKRDQSSVIWMGIKEGAEPLKALHNEVIRLLRAHDLSIPKITFRPHITLARQVKFNPYFDFSDLSLKPVQTKVKYIHLYESHRVGGKLTYTPRKTIILKG